MGDSKVTVAELLEAADAASSAWASDVETLYRSALNAAKETGAPVDQIKGWFTLGAYFFRRARNRPAVLAYAQAWNHARKVNDQEWSAAAAIGIFHCLGELGDQAGALAARLYLGQVSESEWASLPRATQKQLQRPESALEASIAEIQRAMPDFEQRFLSGELRFDRPADFVDLFERRARHRQTSLLAQAGQRELAAYRRQFLRRLILPALPFLGLALIYAAGWLPLGRWILLVLFPLVLIYLAIWIPSVRRAWRWFSAQRKMRELDPALDELIDRNSTHLQAVAILRRFAEQREPFVLYLRSFEGEASQSVTPEGTTPKRVRKAEFVNRAILQGSSADGYIEPNQMVLSFERGPSDFEKYLGGHLARVIPVVTIANPAASLGRSSVPRLEMENDAWGRAVRLLMNAAHFIVIEPARNTAGVCLELDLTKESNRHSDTIIVLPSEKTRQEMDETRKLMTIEFDQPVGPTSKFLSANDEILSGFPRVLADDVFADRDPTTIRAFRDVLPERKVTNPEDYGQRRRERDALRGEGISLHLKGVELLDGGQPAEASDLFQRAAAIFEQCGDSAHLAMPLTYLGRAAQALSDLRQAETCFAAAAEIQRETGPPRDYIGSIHHLALVFLELGAVDRAQATFEKMRQASQNWAYARGEARAVEGLALISFAAGDRLGAAEQLREALKLSSDPRDQSSISQTLNRVEQALSESSGAAPLTEEESKRLAARNEIVATYNAAVRELETGNARDGIDKLNQALSISRDSSMADLQQKILFRLGMAYSQAGQNGIAIDFLQQSVDVARELNNPAQVALAQSNIGTLLVREGKAQEGIEELKAAEQAQRAQGDKGELAYTLNALGNAYFVLGDYENSLPRDEEALRLHQAHNHSAQISALMERIGLAQMYVGRQAEARTTFLETAKLADGAGQKKHQAAHLALAAKLSSDLGDSQQSSELFAQSIAIWQELGDEQGAATVRDLAQRTLESGQKGTS